MRRRLLRLRKQLQAQPNPYNLWFETALLLARLERWEEAESFVNEAYSRVESEKDGFAAVVCLRAKVLLRLQKINEAEAMLHSACQKLSDISGFYYWHGKTIASKGEMHEALRFYKQCIWLESHAAASAASKGYSWQAFEELGWLALQMGCIEKAAAYFYKSVEIRPEHAQAWCGLADVFYQIGCSDHDISEKLAALGPGPELIAHALFQVGACKEALEQLEDVQQPTSSAVSLLRAQCLARLGRRYEACTEMVTALNGSHSKKRLLLNVGIALCCWSEGHRVPEKLYERMNNRMRQRLLWTQQHLFTDGYAPARHIRLLTHLVEQAVEWGLLNLARRLAALRPELETCLIKTWYRWGHIQLAQQGLWRLKQKEQLDDECAYMIAELYFDRGDWGLALAHWQKRSWPPALQERVRRAISDSLLHCNGQNPPPSGSRYVGAHWHTVWNGLQRRNAALLEDAFPAHEPGK